MDVVGAVAAATGSRMAGKRSAQGGLAVGIRHICSGMPSVCGIRAEEFRAAWR
jgi:hypothetical protein